MIGMTPAWLTFSGRYCLVPPKTRRPRTCLADWVGIRRWLSVIAITPTTTAMNSASSKIMVMIPYLPGSGVSFEVEFSQSPFMATGTRARMPAMISRLIPLPIPYSSICSPTHIRKIVPGRHDADAHHAMPEVAILRKYHVHLWTHHVLHPEGALDRAEADGGVAGVFVDAFPPALSLLHHGLERGDDAAQKLEDDRRRDVGHDPQAEDRAHADRRAAEHGHGAEQLARPCWCFAVPPSSATAPG